MSEYMTSGRESLSSQQELRAEEIRRLIKAGSRKGVPEG